MNILITGGAGYIGSHCAKLLKASGFQPVVLDDLSRGSRRLARYGPFIEGDCRDTALVRETLKDYQIQAVFHLAGFAYVEESVRKPLKYFSNNVGSLLSVLEAMEAEKVDSLVFSSSCTVYGNSPEPVTEASLLDPQCPYAKSKALCEKILHETEKSAGIRSVTLRYFNVAGCDPGGEVGELHEPETHILPLMIRAALGDRPHFEIFGNDYPTPDGTCVRDYIHVSDVADAHLRALTWLKNGGDSRIYNLANAEGISNHQLALEVKRLTGMPFEIHFGPRRPGDQPSHIGCAAKIQKELGWEPTHSSLETIVSTAIQWELAQRPAPAKPEVAPRQHL